ncbi:acyl-CoA dehydrogenase family protein [Acinetobacter sp. YK3]|uniref:acyl-CoA dehydrogenase family protein n=1 Tax=Acinetobacter sp. YK3 TaxID=1860097 RepID=UPI00084CDE0C|nr:acyl-CoA dehydrogenase family protein [Acinetobacter sp. YK3]OEC89665.1 acyl-CoA dehydrogenase [Acinetobacter sp. YK3]
MHITTEHEALRRTARQFVESEINPYILEWERQGQFPIHDVFKKMGSLGLLGICKPEENGGLGLDISYNLIVAEEFGRSIAGGVAMAMGVQTDMATPALARFGSKELRDMFLTPAIAGDYVGAIAVSEAHAGSDVAAIKTTACKDNDDYIINGSKMWITNGGQADFFCLLANTSDDKPHRNKSLIVVPSHLKGVSTSKPLHKLGMHSTNTAQVFFDDVRVPQHYLIGNEGAGFAMQMMQFQEERLWVCANALGSLDLCLEQTIQYTRERTTFGQPVINNQYVHFRFAELATEIEALRALTYHAAELHGTGKDVTMLASMAKLKAGRLLREVTDSCLQYWGGNGFMWDNLASQLLRDTRVASIAGGTDEIMLGIITKNMNMLPNKI